MEAAAAMPPLPAALRRLFFAVGVVPVLQLDGRKGRRRRRIRLLVGERDVLDGVEE